MKKLVCLILALTMLMGLAACGTTSDSAGDTAGNKEEAPVQETVSQLADSGEKMEMPKAGVTFSVPSSFKELKGVVHCYDGGEIIEGDGVVYCEMMYIAKTQEEYDALTRKTDPTDEELDDYINSVLDLFMVFGINQGRGADELKEYLAGVGFDANGLEEVGAAGDYTYYIFAQDNGRFADDLGEYNEEYARLYKDIDSYKAMLSFAEPELTGSTAASGTQISFTTTDLDGNPIDSAELFAQHDVTMVNIWATWCIYCVREMPELEELNKEFAEKNCAIVGLLEDETDDATLSEAKDILKDTGVTYTNIWAPDNVMEVFPAQAFPTSYFVDSKGRIVGQAIVGAQIDQYAAGLEAALAEIGK